MNIVFWLLVVVALVLVWFCLSFAFKGLGGIGMKLFNGAKDEITGEKEEKENDNKDEEG